MKNEVIRDIVCQVVVNSQSKDLIYSVLNEFLPNYEKLNLDYACKPNDKKYVFGSEDEMISYFIGQPSLEQAFYWSKKTENPYNLTVGVNITCDNRLIFSLTFDGTSDTESQYYLKLKELLKATVGVISYISPAEFENGNDFIKRYKDVKYDFEK